MRGLLLVLLSLTATGAMAENAWYAGAGFGMTNLRTEANLSPNAEIDGWESGYQLFGGYKLGTLWALEFGYIDFGEGDDEVPTSVVPGGETWKYSMTGFYLNGQYHIPISSRVSLDLDGGWIFGEAESEQNILNSATPAFTTSYDDNGAMLGLAFTWRTTDALYLRGSANYFLIDFDSTIKNPWRLGIDVIWDF